MLEEEVFLAYNEEDRILNNLFHIIDENINTGQ